MAVLSSIQTVTALATATIIFNATKYNVGTCYNTTNGTFTAPYTGRYLITAQLQWAGMDANKPGSCELFTSGGTAIAKSGWIYAPGFAGNVTASINVIVELTASTGYVIKGYNGSNTDESVFGDSSVYLQSFFQAEYLGA